MNNNNSYHHQQLNMNNINSNLNNQPQQQQQQNYFNNNGGGGGGGGGGSKKGIIIVRATHEYIPVNNDEIHIRPGDIITITNPEEGGWWEGTLDNQTGWFPSNYVTTVAVDSATTTTMHQQQPPMSPNQPQQQQQPSSLSLLSTTTTEGDDDVGVAAIVGVGGGAGGGGNNQLLQQQSDEYKKMILNEMVESERRFVGEMEEFYERFLGGGGGGFLSNNNMEPTSPSSPPPTSPSPHDGTATIKSQLRQAYNNIIQSHKSHLLNPLQSHVSQIIHNSSENNLRIGKIFLSAATQLESAHTRYCSLHPRFVQFVEKSHRGAGDEEGTNGNGREDATTATAMTPVVLQMITSLSAPFRRIERYGNLLNELDCHVESYHGDKGDLRRGIQYYRDFEKSLTALRKQKEMELEVLTANPSQIKELEGPDISTLGEILLMNLLYQGRDREPRYFVLFPTTILILAYDTGDSSFTYKGRVQIGGITTVTNVVGGGGGGRRGSDNSNGRRDGGGGAGDDDEDVMNAFEIAGPTLHPILIQCPTPRVKQLWLQNLNDVIRATTRCCSYPTTTTSPSPQQQQLAQQHQQFPHHHSSTTAITSNSGLGLPPQAPQHLHHHHQQHHNSNMNNNSSSSSSTLLLTTPQIQAWNITRLRPSPPYNPFLAEYQQQGQQQQQQNQNQQHYRGSGSSGGGPNFGGRSSSGRSISGSGGFNFGKTGSFSGFSSSSSVATTGVSNEDDFAVLSIVDGFCVRAGSGRGGGGVVGHNSSSNILLRTDPSNRSLRSLQDYHFNHKNNNHTSSSSRPQSPSSVFLSPTTTTTSVPSLSKQQQQQQQLSSGYNSNINNNNNFPRPTTTTTQVTTPALHQLVKYLRDDITSLNERIGSLTKQLDEEKEARGELANVVMGVTRMLRPSITTTSTLTLDEEQINNNIS